MCTADLYSALNDSAVCERGACPGSALTELVSMKIVLGRDYTVTYILNLNITGGLPLTSRIRLLCFVRTRT